jgi:hypothetical protein
MRGEVARLEEERLTEVLNLIKVSLCELIHKTKAIILE